MEDIKKLNRIKAVLAERNITGKQLAKDLNVSPITVSRWAQNTSQPDLYTLDKIATVLNVCVKDLLVSYN